MGLEVLRRKREEVGMEPIVVWRRPAKRGRSTPLVVLLHGRGADEHDLIDLAADLPRSFAFASLRGPLALAEGGFRWFEDRGVARPVAASLRATVAGVRAWVDGPDVAAYDRSRTFLLGFSAGMMLAGALVLDDPARFAGAVLLSGAIALDAGPATPGRLAGVPIFSARGTADTTIPPDLVLQTQRYLRDRSGAVLAERTYPCEHSIARREISDIAAWFEERA
jgi:phospholipase/carboxylesterase